MPEKNKWFPDRKKRKGGGGKAGQDPVDRFNDKISHTDDNGCHVWGGAANSRGYGCFAWGGKGKSVLAHRWAYEHLGGNDIPEGLVIDHECRNRLCVNPEHMRVVTNGENILCGQSPIAINSRKTHCKKGHPLSGENLYVYKRKTGENRHCRTCAKVSRQAYRDRKKAATAKK